MNKEIGARARRVPRRDIYDDMPDFAHSRKNNVTLQFIVSSDKGVARIQSYQTVCRPAPTLPESTPEYQI